MVTVTTSGASSRSSAAPRPSRFAVERPIKRNLLNNHYEVRIHVSCSSCSNPNIDVRHRQTTAVSTRICRRMFRKSTCQSRQSWGGRGPAYARHLPHTGGWASEFIHMAVCRMVAPYLCLHSAIAFCPSVLFYSAITVLLPWPILAISCASISGKELGWIWCAYYSPGTRAFPFASRWCRQEGLCIQAKRRDHCHEPYDTHQF